MELQGIRSDVREIRDALVGARGSWKAICLVVGLSVSLGAAVAKLLPFVLTPGHWPSSSPVERARTKNPLADFT